MSDAGIFQGLPNKQLFPEHLIKQHETNISFNFVCCKGELLALRMPSNVDLNQVGSHLGFYMFDDGGMKALAAAVALLGCIAIATTESVETLRHPRMLSLVMSLLQIPTLHKTQASDEVNGMIQRIIKQNVDSKKLPVSSFEWAGILEKLGSEHVSLADAVARYNDNPEVCAHGSLNDPCQISVFFCIQSLT